MIHLYLEPTRDRVRLTGTREVPDVFVNGAPLRLTLTPVSFLTKRGALEYIDHSFPGRRIVTRNGVHDTLAETVVHDRTTP